MTSTTMVRVTPLLLGALLLIGAGCTSATPPSDQGSESTGVMTKSADETTGGTGIDTGRTNEPAMPIPPSPMNDGSITLTAEPAGKGMVKLHWDVTEDTDASDGFMLVRSPKPDPIHDTLNYWWRQHEKSREATWINVPSGNQHIRVCILRDAECAVYSNDVEVVVQ